MAPVGHESIGQESIGRESGRPGIDPGHPAPGAAASSRVMPAEIVGDGTMAGVIGASAIALFFLLVDTVRREALFTPSVMASALLRGDAPSAAGEVDLSMVAAYSVIHGAAFVAIGILAAWATALRRSSVATFTLAIALFATLELGFLFACVAIEPGLLDAVGVAPATIGNLLSAIGMAFYLHRWPHDSIEEREAYRRGHQD
jgi:vacuolar-type H+-ATPase subunit I/STV1